MELLRDYLITHPLVYITRDIERALALEPRQGYYIITNKTKTSQEYFLKHPKNVLIIEQGEKLLDTHELMAASQTIKYLHALKGASLLVFKNTRLTEKIALENKWSLLNPSSSLSQRVEEKIEQVQWLREYEGYLPAHSILKLKDAGFKNQPFILQFNHSHTGGGTILIENQADLEKIKKIFPEREVRKTEYIEGDVITSNNIVGSEKILMGNVSHQITGMSPFTDMPFATIGNDFSLANRTLSPSQLTQYKKIVTDIGNKLKLYGWRGLFGIDAVVSKKTGRVYLIEINARQPASTTFESHLQNMNRKNRGISGMTVFEAHLMSLFGLPFSDESLIPISEGSQIIQRITKNRKIAGPNTAERLAKAGFSVLTYENSENNSELLRIQSSKGIMENSASFNVSGRKILSILN